MPTRRRPKELRRMYESVKATATNMPEIVVYCDEDDEPQATLALSLGMNVLIGARERLMTVYWNKCYEISKGDIVCQCNDDVIFHTPGWDEMVEDEFQKWPDRIVMVYGNDLGKHFEHFGPHPFVHRRWVDTLGYFIPPYFTSDYGDAWVNSLAASIKRRVYIPIMIEHMHFLMGKAEKDEITLERLAREDEDRPQDIWDRTVGERRRDALKLLALIEEANGEHTETQAQCTA